MSDHLQIEKPTFKMFLDSEKQGLGYYKKYRQTWPRKKTSPSFTPVCCNAAPSHMQLLWDYFSDTIHSCSLPVNPAVAHGDVSKAGAPVALTEN